MDGCRSNVQISPLGQDTRAKRTNEAETWHGTQHGDGEEESHPRHRRRSPARTREPAARRGKRAPPRRAAARCPLQAGRVAGTSESRVVSVVGWRGLAPVCAFVCAFVSACVLSWVDFVEFIIIPINLLQFIGKFPASALSHGAQGQFGSRSSVSIGVRAWNPRRESLLPEQHKAQAARGEECTSSAPGQLPATLPMMAVAAMATVLGMILALGYLWARRASSGEFNLQALLRALLDVGSWPANLRWAMLPSAGVEDSSSYNTGNHRHLTELHERLGDSFVVRRNGKKVLYVRSAAAVRKVLMSDSFGKVWETDGAGAASDLKSAVGSYVHNLVQPLLADPVFSNKGSNNGGPRAMLQKTFAGSPAFRKGFAAEIDAELGSGSWAIGKPVDALALAHDLIRSALYAPHRLPSLSTPSSCRDDSPPLFPSMPHPSPLGHLASSRSKVLPLPAAGFLVRPPLCVPTPSPLAPRPSPLPFAPRPPPASLPCVPMQLPRHRRRGDRRAAHHHAGLPRGAHPLRRAVHRGVPRPGADAARREDAHAPRQGF